MNGTPQPARPRDRSTGLLVCLLVTALAALLPPLAGFLMDLVTDPHGPLGRLYTVMGIMVGLTLGPVVLLICVIILLLQNSRWGRGT